MQAYVFRTAGVPKDVLKLERAYPIPTPAEDELLIRVKATALNPVAYKTMSVFPVSLMQKKPAVPEHDFAGIVEGGNVDGTGLKIGDEVFGIVPAELGLKVGKGTLAQYTVAKKDLVVKKPDNVSFGEAAAFPLTALTAFWSLQAAGLKKGAGQRVFINGGSSGTGLWGVQVAHHYGATVVCTSSSSSRQTLTSLSPTPTLIDYKSTPLIPHLSSTYSTSSSQFDIIFDTVGLGELYYASPTFLKPDGVYVDIAGTNSMHGLWDALKSGAAMANKLLRPRWLGGTPRTYRFELMNSTTKENMAKAHERLLEGAELFGNGTFKSIIDNEYKWSEVQEAYERQMSSRAKGKVVVLVD